MNIYFFCHPHGPAERAEYEHQIVSLAEGLSELGYTPKGNINYWLKSTKQNDYLIREYKVQDYNEFDAIIFSSNIWSNFNNLLPDQLFSSSRKFQLVFIDSSDGLITPGFDYGLKTVDFVLKSHYCKKYNYPKNFRPWQFGLTNRIIEYSNKYRTSSEKKNKVIFSNFRVVHPLRIKFEEVLKSYFYDIYPKYEDVDDFKQESRSEIENLFWRQTGRRHYEKYYKKIGVSLITNAVGGNIEKRIIANNGFFERIIKNIDSKFNFLEHDRVYQFDSWRFWESLAAGSCTLHVDFDKYGIVLPEMPVNGVHYVGIDIDNPTKALKWFADEDDLISIAENGYRWALEFYSPKAVATRLLNLLQK